MLGGCGCGEGVRGEGGVEWIKGCVGWIVQIFGSHRAENLGRDELARSVGGVVALARPATFIFRFPGRPEHNDGCPVVSCISTLGR